MARTLLRGGIVVTLEPGLGDPRPGDVLVEDDRVAAIGPRLDAGAAEVVDASGFIVMPGLVNAHMHTWQTALRGVAANWTLLEYFRHMHAGLATRFRPEDIHVATLVGALNQINCGTTTLADWCHNNPTPVHTDAAVDALTESGIRAVFLHGSPKPDPKPGAKPFWEVPHPRHEIDRLASRLPSADGLVTLGMAILGPHYSTYEVAVADLRLARERGLVASMHVGGGEARVPDGWRRLAGEGLLDDRTNIVHGNSLTDRELQTLVDAGASFSVTPEGEMTQGHGFTITGRLRALAAGPSLGVDLESAMSGDMFTVMRMGMGFQRALDNAESRARDGKLPDTSTVPAREALEWGTLRGARALRMDERIGTLAPGKQADIVLLRATDLNMWPVHDPVRSIVTQASIANVDSVMIAGRWKKRHGRLLYDRLPRRLEALALSGERILGEMANAG